jgi:hypothetical protein
MNWPVVGWPKETETARSSPGVTAGFNLLTKWPNPATRPLVTHRAANGWSSELPASFGFRVRPGNLPANNNWQAICWSSELRLFCALGASGTGNRVMTSPDGRNWSLGVSPSDSSWGAVVWAKELGIFLAISFDSLAAIGISRDGKTWTQTSTSLFYFISYYNRVVWSSKLKLFAVNAYRTTDGRSCLFTSPDGLTWTTRHVDTSGSVAGVTGLCWSEEQGLFVATLDSSGAETGLILTSPDGLTWTKRNLPFTPIQFCSPRVLWAEGVNAFYWYPSVNDSQTAFSFNGIDWVQAHLAGGQSSWSTYCVDARIAINPAVSTRLVPDITQGVTLFVRSDITSSATFNTACYAKEIKTYVALGTNSRAFLTSP